MNEHFVSLMYFKYLCKESNLKLSQCDNCDTYPIRLDFISWYNNFILYYKGGKQVYGLPDEKWIS